LLEPAHVRDQVRVQVVAVERAPELLVPRAAQQRVEERELLHGFGQRGVAGRGGGAGADAAGARGQNVRRQEVTGEGEVWGREHGEGFDEDVGDGLVAREVWVELVSASSGLAAGG
ncbi:MAG: hypothetical protein Q9167_008111, partial [Letrouitia subvulpina]